MPIPGPLMHKHLMDAYAKIQTDLASSRIRIADSKQRRDELDNERSEALVDLAEHYLPELTGSAVEETWVEIRASVTEILQRKHDHARRVNETLDRLTLQRQEQEQSLVEINQQLDSAVERQLEVADQVEQSLRSDPRFMELSDRAARAEAALERAEENLAEIDQDAARKLPAYEKSSLFQYLRQRNYGTSDYTRRGLTRRLDRWLAGLVDYSHARKGYEFLRNTPESMRKIIAEDRQALEIVMEELERRRDEIAAGLALAEAIEQCNRLEKDRDAKLEQLDGLLAETELAQNELTELEDTRGPYYRSAIDMFRDMFQRMSSRDLKRRAQQTAEITDDQIVARLLGVESDMDQLDESARRRRDRLMGNQSFLENLGRLIQRYRVAEFDSARSQFVGSFDVFAEVERAQEYDDIEGLWNRIRNAQRWAPSAGEQIAAVASHPLTQVLINAMAHAAGGTLSQYARRAGRRRSFRDSPWKQWTKGFGSWSDSNVDRRRGR